MATTTTKTKNFTEGVGRRKTSVARVRITPAAKTSIVINDRPLKEYFPVQAWIKKIEDVLVVANAGEHFTISVRVVGGGVSSQAEAVVHGLARALNDLDRNTRPALKKAKLLSRDSRMKERRKFGLKKARKSPQWSKR